MKNSFRTNPDYQQVLRELELSDGLLRDAWVVHDGERWYPKLLTDRESGKRGFEYMIGKWGPKDGPESKKVKLSLEELLQLLAEESIPPTARIRCSRDVRPREGNGRRISALQKSDRIERLLALCR